MYKVTVVHADVVGERIKVYANKATDTIEFFEGAGQALAEIEQEWFDSAGGGSWPELSEEWAARKGSDEILIWKGPLIESLTTGEAMDITGPDSAVFGTDIPYAEVHQEGMGVPVRDPIAPQFIMREALNQLLEQMIRYG